MTNDELLALMAAQISAPIFSAVNLNRETDAALHGLETTAAEIEEQVTLLAKTSVVLARKIIDEISETGGKL